MTVLLKALSQWAAEDVFEVIAICAVSVTGLLLVWAVAILLYWFQVKDCPFEGARKVLLVIGTVVIEWQWH